MGTRGAVEEDVRQNWSGTRSYAASNVVRPDSLDVLPDVVTSSGRVHALGSRHSFNGVADTTGTHVVLDHLPASVEVDVEARTATVAAWATYGQIAPGLEQHGLALQALASLPHVSVAGACATATHGSGVAVQCLAAAVRAMTFVDGTGTIVETSREADPDTFPGLVVHLGAIGVVTSVTLDLVPSVPWHQRVWVDLPGAALVDDLDEVMGGAESVSCFTRWQQETVDMVVHKSTRDPRADPVQLLGAPRATETQHPERGGDAAAVTEQLGVEGPWYERLPHFRLGFTPSSGDEIQSEWFVDREDGAAAVAAMFAVGERLGDALRVSELRTVAADDLWLSPAHRRDVVGIHCTWTDDADRVARAIDVVEETLAPFDPYPHWGKVSHLDRAGPARRRGRLDDFAALVARHDPDGRFRNRLLDDLVS